MEDIKEKILNELYNDKRRSQNLINDFNEKIHIYLDYKDEENKKISKINDIIRKLE